MPRIVLLAAAALAVFVPAAQATETHICSDAAYRVHRVTMLKGSNCGAARTVAVAWTSGSCRNHSVRTCHPVAHWLCENFRHKRYDPRTRVNYFYTNVACAGTVESTHGEHVSFRYDEGPGR